MARPLKKGLGYFSLDVDFYNDIKVRKIVRRKGGDALTVYIVLLCNIYEKGYYLEWNEDIPFLICEATGYGEDRIKDIILYCIEVGLFDKNFFEQYQIITSYSIQRRYKAIGALTKRKMDKNAPYLLEKDAYEDISSEERMIKSKGKAVNSEETTNNLRLLREKTSQNRVSSEKTPQSKVKKNKIKENIGSSSEPSSSVTTQVGDDVNFIAFMEFFNKTMQECGAQICTITQITTKRQQAIRARAKEYGKEALRKAVINAATSPFLNGATDNPFVATFDWMFRPNNFVKVLEGNYNQEVLNNKSKSHGTAQKLTAQQRIDAEIQRGIEHFNSIDVNGGTAVHRKIPKDVR